MSIKAQRFLNGMIDIVIPLLATAIALILGAFMLIAFRKNPLEAYAALVSGAFGSSRALIQTTLKATPLLLVGTGICIAFRGGVTNIGGEGQIIVGALSSAAVALYVPIESRWLPL